MKILIALLVFELIIVIHEFGHFIVAKLCGVKVNEFSIGLGPAIIKKQKGETLYALRVVPFGGYCAMEGEDSESDKDDERSFNNKSIPKRFAILIAGITMNLLLGFILLVIYTVITAPITSTTVSKFETENAASHVSGLQIGDEIVSINGMHIFTDMDMSYQFQNDDDGIFDMVVVRDGEKVELKDVKFDYNDKKMHIDFFVKPVEANFFTVTSYAFRHTVTDGRLIYITLADMIRGKYKLSDLSGPVGIVNVIGDVIESETSEEEGINWRGLFEQLLSLASFITINVGLFNLLPLPALDGGRLLFLIIEAVRRKPIPREKEGMIHLIGMAVILLLMVIVTVSDVIKLF